MYLGLGQEIQRRRYLLFFLIIVLISNAGLTLGADNRQIIKSEEILDKIRNHEPINYSSVIIEGDLCLWNVSSSIPTFIDSPIKIIDSEIRCNIYFNKSIFNRPVSFEKTKFNGIVRFDETVFREYANFGQSVFNGPASFSGAKFRGSASFWKSTFSRIATFRKSEFLEGSIDFHKSEFKDIAVFNFASFGGFEVTFESSYFNGTTDFRQARFNGNAIFLGSRFKEDADFSGSQFNSSSNFLGSRFDRVLYFYKVKFKNLNINWDSIHHNLVSDEPGYIVLIKNFKDFGQFEDADNCYYEYRERKQHNMPFEWAKILTFLAWLTCGYGVRWTHPIFSGLLVIMSFGIYYEMFDLEGIIRKNLFGRKALKDETIKLSERLKKAFLFSMIVLLSLPPEWYPYGKEEYSKLINLHLFSAIIERLIGYGLMLLLIGTLTRLMVRY